MWGELLGRGSVKKLDEIRFKGHANVIATHSSTLELTRDEYLTPRGDCIIGVGSDKSAATLTDESKKYLRGYNPVFFELRVGGENYVFCAWGDPRLRPSDTRSIVIRRSSYVCPRTIAVRSTAAAADIPRGVVERLKRGARGTLVIYGLARILL